MTREQVKEIFKTLTYAYSKFEVSKEKLDLWHKYLEDQDFQTVMNKTERYILDKPFPPSIADLREARKREDKSVLAQFWEVQA